MEDFEGELERGEADPVEGWDFGWFEGRATEERTDWGYAGLLAERIAAAEATLDVQTGGGEVYAGALAAARESAGRSPSAVRATDSYPPNLAIARERLAPYDGEVSACGNDEPLPFAEGTFDLVSSRHPVSTAWGEVARVLRPGGTFLSQQVGPGSNRGLYEFLLGPQPLDDRRSAENLARGARDAGLAVLDLREQSTRVEFFDLASVVHFLRKVVWTVPGFTVDGYRDRLAALYDRIRMEGSFVCHSERVLIVVRKPA